MTAGFPSGLDTAFDVEGDDLDGDYNRAEEEPADSQIPHETPAQISQGRSVKAYLIKYTAYKTFVGDSNAQSQRQSLMKKQPARHHLVHLFRRDIFQP